MPSLKGISENLLPRVESLIQQQLIYVNKALKPSSSVEQDNNENSTDREKKNDSLAEYIVYSEKFSVDLRKKVLLLSGESKSGKTIFCHHLLNKFLKPSSDQNVLPIYIDLDKVEDIKQPFIEAYLHENYGFTIENIDELKKYSGVLFIFDHFGNKGMLVNLYITQQLANWNAKSIIACDRQHLTKFRDYKPCFVPYLNQRRQVELFDELSLSNLIIQNKDAQSNKTNAPQSESTKQQRIIKAVDFPGNIVRTHSTNKNESSRLEELLLHLLNQKILVFNEAIISLLADKAKEDKNFCNFLFEFVYGTRCVHKLKIGAANAMTILNRAGISFAGLDLSGVDLSGENGQGADLTNG